MPGLFDLFDLYKLNLFIGLDLPTAEKPCTLQVSPHMSILCVGLLSSLKFQHHAGSSQSLGRCGWRDDRLQEWIQPQRQRSCYFVVRWCARITLGWGGGSTFWPPVGVELLVWSGRSLAMQPLTAIRTTHQCPSCLQNVLWELEPLSSLQ